MGGLTTRELMGGAAATTLGGSVLDLLRVVRGDLGDDGEGDGGDAVAGLLARHAIVRPVLGCAVCTLESDHRVRVAGTAGETGSLTTGSLWPLGGSPVSQALSGDLAPAQVNPASSELGRAMCGGTGARLVVLPLRVGAHRAGEPTSLGALLVARESDTPFSQAECDSLEVFASVATFALLAQRNAELYRQARTATETMSSFLNLMVHDLRTPLAVMGGYASLLRNGTFGEAPQRWAKPMELIAAKIDETKALVDEILLAARLDAGVVPTTIERVDLNDVVRRAAERSEARASLVGAAVEAVVVDEPVHAAADSFHVDRIVDNLVNNAFNYSGEAPWVRLSVDPSDPPAIRVEDRGVGIDRDMHERIFDRFVRGETRVPGTGFGLHVGRVLAQACGGSLSVERSVPGKGSVFRLQLRGCTTEPAGTAA